VTSVSTKQALPNMILSNSVRLATIGLIKSLALELGSEGIRFNSILPGWTETERVTSLIGHLEGKSVSLSLTDGSRLDSCQLISAGHHGTTSDMIGNLLEDTTGNWWIGTWQGGLNYYDAHTNTFTYYSSDPRDLTGINDPFVQSMFLDSRHNLWIGTMGNGLNLLTPAAGRFIRYRHDEKNSQSLSNDIINYILEDKKGRLWVGTLNGLNLFNPATQTFSKYFQKDGLPNNVIQGMLEDKKGNLWIATNNGISRFDPEAKTFQNYEYNDGLQGAVFNRGACLKTLNGDMFFGGSRGFNIFNPDSIRANTLVPPVYITDFQVFNQSVKPGEKGSPLKTPIIDADGLTLSYKQSVFSFEFTALNYSLQEKNQYAYKMEGFDKDWNMVGTQRKATYTNLDPGEYTFRVKASNNDGIWNEEGASIKIFITPPFWKTAWFTTLLIVLAIGGVYAIYRSRTKAKMRQLEENKREEMHRLHMQFFTNISHEFRTPLSLILGPLEKLMKEDNPDQLYNYYRTRTFECNGTPMWRLVEKLNEVYKVHIVIGENRLHDLKLTTTFVDESLDGILNVVSKTFGITVVRSGQEIILK